MQPLDLAEMRQKYLRHEGKYWFPDQKHNWTWTIVRTPREGCGLIEKDVNYFPNAGVYSGRGGTKLRTDTLQNVHSTFQGSPVDITETQLGPTQDKLPQDFSGCGGGGMYQTREGQIGDQFTIEEKLLAGIFVAGNEKTGWLYSRGRMALYDIFCRFLDVQIRRI